MDGWVDGWMRCCCAVLVTQGLQKARLHFNSYGEQKGGSLSAECFFPVLFYNRTVMLVIFLYFMT